MPDITSPSPCLAPRCILAMSHVDVKLMIPQDVHTYTGRPAIFSLQERTLSVLQCKVGRRAQATS
jgi:hypothetical protein